MKAHKLPSGSWRVQVQINGVRRSFTAKSKKEAERAALKSILNRPEAPTIDFRHAVEYFIANRENVLSASTTARYKRIVKKYMPELMPVQLRYLTAERMQAAINRMSKKYAPKTVRNAWGLFSAALKSYGLTFDIVLPQKKRKEYNVPTEKQVFDLIDAAKGNIKTAVILAAFCGLRRGEIVALESSDIKDGMIHVCRCAVYDDAGKLIFKQPKTYHSDRYIKEFDIVRNALEGKTGRVCPVHPSGITTDFIRLRKRVGVECRFHDLRHFFASWLHSLGVRDQYIMKWGGWKTDSTLKAIYRNTLDDVEDTAADMVNARINAHAAHTDSP